MLQGREPGRSLNLHGYLMEAVRRMLVAPAAAATAALSDLVAGSPKHRQNLRVSSAPAVTTVLPSGDTALWRTLWVWPVSSATCKEDPGGE